LWLFSAFAAADFTTFSIISEPLPGVNFSIVNASFKSLPRTKSVTGFSLIGEILTYLAIAFASIPQLSFSTQQPELPQALRRARMRWLKKGCLQAPPQRRRRSSF
jgi:hypothetical protein